MPPAEDAVEHGTEVITALSGLALAACVGTTGGSGKLPDAAREPPQVSEADSGIEPDVDADAGEPEQASRELDSLGPNVLVLGSPPGTTFSFTLPEGTYGFQLAGGFTFVDSLTDPDGTAHWTGGRPAGWPSGLGAPWPAQALMNEETLALGVPPGEWLVTLLAPTGGTPISLVTQRDHDAAFHGGVLDVFLYIAHGGVVDPDRSVTITPTNVLDEYAAGLDEFFENLHQLVDIDRGEVTVIEVDDRYARIATYEEAVAAFGVSHAGLGPGYHVLLLLGGVELGWSGYAPGVPAVQIGGDPQSTVLMDVRSHDYFGWTLAHELGHVTGLYHTTDYWEGELHHDPLDDTPECPLAVDYGDYTIPGCHEESNLMASFGTGRPPTLSPTQRAVFRSSAVYRPYAGEVPTPHARRSAPEITLPPLDVVARWTRCTPPR